MDPRDIFGQMFSVDISENSLYMWVKLTCNKHKKRNEVWWILWIIVVLL